MIKISRKLYKALFPIFCVKKLINEEANMATKIEELESKERELMEGKHDFIIHIDEDLEKVPFGLRTHDFIEILFVLSGNVTYFIEKGRYDMREYDAIITPPHTLHELNIRDNSSTFKRIVIWVQPQYLKKISSEQTDLFGEINKFLKNGHNLIRNPELVLAIRPFAERIKELKEKQPYGYDLLVENAFREMIITINTFLHQNIANPVKPEGNQIVLDIISYIDAHLNTSLSLKEIADYVKLDEFYISHLFSKEVGVTIHKYIVKKRLNQAKLMLDLGKSIDEIIEIIGFNDKSHFIQSFKKEYNVTPNKYRTLNK